MTASAIVTRFVLPFILFSKVSCSILPHSLLTNSVGLADSPQPGKPIFIDNDLLQKLVKSLSPVSSDKNEHYDNQYDSIDWSDLREDNVQNYRERPVEHFKPYQPALEEPSKIYQGPLKGSPFNIYERPLHDQSLIEIQQPLNESPSNVYQGPAHDLPQSDYHRPIKEKSPNSYQFPEQETLPNVKQHPVQELPGSWHQKPVQEVYPNTYPCPEQEIPSNVYQRPANEHQHPMQETPPFTYNQSMQGISPNIIYSCPEQELNHNVHQPPVPEISPSILQSPVQEYPPNIYQHPTKEMIQSLQKRHMEDINSNDNQRPVKELSSHLNQQQESENIAPNRPLSYYPHFRPHYPHGSWKSHYIEDDVVIPEEFTSASPEREVTRRVQTGPINVHRVPTVVDDPHSLAHTSS